MIKKLIFNRKKLKFYKLLPSDAETLDKDITVTVTNNKTARYRQVHPIFIPMCLTWINVGQLDDQMYDLHVLGSTNPIEIETTNEDSYGIVDNIP